MKQIPYETEKASNPEEVKHVVAKMKGSKNSAKSSSSDSFTSLCTDI